MNPDPLTPNAVFVAWRDPVHHRCYPVGRLSRVLVDGNDEYEFAYVRGVDPAREAGFRTIASFDEIERVYWSRTLYPFFANRIMAESRPDRAAFLDRLLLRSADPLEVLARTGGIRATDSFEVFPLPRFDAEVPGFRTLFLVHALRHFPPTAHDRIQELGVGEKLLFMPDSQNEFDPHAIALRTEDRVLVGHVPNYLLLEVYQLAANCEFAVEFSVAKINPPPAPLDQRMLCELRSCWPPNFYPFVDARFRPVSHLQAIQTEKLIGAPDEIEWYSPA
ncbi:MAG TPA: HIRAN domain-containing protein [Phycisphaerae bacterium]|nr:HIRAN domain-containing protein [Phycisphaerae bacterium]